MSDLKPVTLTFDGQEYKVEKEDGIWGLIEAVENVITFFELAPALSSQRYPIAKIFRAYAAALNYAGANVTANQVRAASTSRDMGQMAGALVVVLMMAQPGADVDLPTGDEGDEGGKRVQKKAKGKSSASGTSSG